MLGRRKFLGTLSAGMATTMVPAGVLSAASLRDQLAGLVDDNFQFVDSAGGSMRARLVALDDGPECPGLQYRVYHPSTGTLRIGLMASGEAGSTSGRQRAFFSDFV